MENSNPVQNTKISKIGILLTFLVGGLGLLTMPSLANAQTANPKPLPIDFSLNTWLSSQIYGGDFLTDPTRDKNEGRVKATTVSSGSQLEIFLINKKECAIVEDSYTYRVLVRNVAELPATNLEIKVGYAAGSDVVHTYRTADEIIVPLHEIIWREAFLAPGGFVEYSFTITLRGGQLYNNAFVEYDYNGSRYLAVTQHLIDGICETPNPTYTPLPAGKFPAIFCDPAEIGCVTIFPNLGVNFERAQKEEQQVNICGGTAYNGRDCPVRFKLPTLGVRFGQATPTILPGECRVFEDYGFAVNDETIAADVETSWCESDGYPQFVIRKAPEPYKERVKTITLPDTEGGLPSGYSAPINQSLVAGTVCGGRPGDPWWAPDCSCQCNEVAACGLCQSCPQGVTLHDIFVTSKEECLLEKGKHYGPFF